MFTALENGEERKGKEEKNRKRKAEEAGSMEEERDFMDE